MNLTTVTVTGADDTVDYVEMLDLSKRFPFVEWGLLYSAKHSPKGAARFPSREWLEHLHYWTPDARDGKLKLCMHLCGSVVRKLVSNDWTVWDVAPFLSPQIGRIQLNFHAQRHVLNARRFLETVYHLTRDDKQLIFQDDGVNNEFYDIAKSCSLNHNVRALYDKSGGLGLLPNAWPRPKASGCGYAGGLSPDNVAAELQKIAITVQEANFVDPCPIWIDAETHLRTKLPDGKDIFDLAKVEAFLKAAEPFVIKEAV